MQAARGDEDDLVARTELGPEPRRLAVRDPAERRAGDVDLLGIDETRQRRRLAAHPGRPDGLAGPAPALDERRGGGEPAYHDEDPVAK